jgi:hypothetical protein
MKVPAQKLIEATDKTLTEEVRVSYFISVIIELVMVIMLYLTSYEI